MDIGQIILKFFVPLLEFLAPFMPGETFSKFFFTPKNFLQPISSILISSAKLKIVPAKS